MCCDGTMFEFVRLQPADSPKKLAGLGLKLKRKRGGTCFQQPCPAFRSSHCAIYSERPERCRDFECSQLRQLAAGAKTEPEAFATIRIAREQVTHITGLLARLGEKPSRRRLKQRCDDALAQAVEIYERPESAQLRAEIADAMGALEAMLDAGFRVAASGSAGDSPGGPGDPPESS